MNIENILKEKTIEALQSLYGSTVAQVSFEKTNPDFTGDLTLVVFNFLKISKKKLQQLRNSRKIGFVRENGGRRIVYKHGHLMEYISANELKKKK